METFVLRWTKGNVPFWQGVDDGEKIEINAVADVINENAALKREDEALRLAAIRYLRNSYAKAGMMNLYNELDALLTKETNDGN